MAHIACLTSGLTGILYAGFEMVSRLEAAGHRVTYASPAPVGEQVRAQGISFVQLPPVNLHPEPELPSFAGPWRKGKRWWFKLTHARHRRRQALNNLGADAVIEHLEDLSADLLIIDVELHEYIFAAYARRLPFVLLSQWFSLWDRPGLPYLLHDTIPGEGWQGHPLAIRMSWWQVRVKRWWMFVRKKIFSVATDRRSSLQALARELQFPPSWIRKNYWPGPFTYDHLPVFSMTAWEMEFPHSKRPHLHYIGPMVYTSRRDVRSDQQAAGRLQEIFARKQRQQAPLIYCSVSSLKAGDQAFLQKVCEAVSREPNWLLIIGLGGKMSAAELGPLPDHIYAFSWVPQLQVLEQADCSINHGGIHTINECLHYQVPMLVYSGKRSDQNGCAARVAYHVLGLRGDKDRDTVDDIYQKIRMVLTDTQYRQRLQQMKAHCERYRLEQILENSVERYLQSSKEMLATSAPR